VTVFFYSKIKAGHSFEAKKDGYLAKFESGTVNINKH
jgi:hypothetical protein